MHKLIATVLLVSAIFLSQSVNARALDVGSLPSVEAITATTDIRPFLAPGVPLKVARAALRRAWMVDPRIRDFRGLQENEWDFDDPRGVPGFGSLDTGESAEILQLMAYLHYTARLAPVRSAQGPAVAHNRWSLLLRLWR